MKPLPLVSLFILFVFSAHSQVFVNVNAHGANNGSSWKDAFTNLDSAIDQTDSGQIWVAAGTYKPSLNAQYYSFKTFTINKQIALYGGFKGTETRLSQRDVQKNVTILSGDVGTQGVDDDNTPRVVSVIGAVDSLTIIDGFTITSAYYTDYKGYDYNNGGIYIWCSGDPEVRNCTIKNNHGFYGGGIYIRGTGTSLHSSPLIVNNLIENNSAYQGAGLYLEYTYARIIGNKISHNRCEGGYTHLAGGGIKIEAYTSPYIYGNTIDSNYARHYGGGIANESNYSVTIENNIISNDSSQYGGGIYVDFSPTSIINNLIVNNKALSSYFSGGGGGLYVNYSYATNSVNNTMCGNYSDNYGGAVYINDGNTMFTNTIIYNNPTKYGKPINCSNYNRKDWFPKFRNCDIENGVDGLSYLGGIYPADSIWQTGNQSAYPQFIDTVNNNYQLIAQSPCINAGLLDTSGLMLPPVDVAGNNRIKDGQIDVGCYEFNNAVLSVRLFYFDAVLKGKSAAVTWKINNTYDASYFELEKSVDGRIFTSLSIMKATSNQSQYTYDDKLLVQGYNYYRLKVVGKDGNQFYSNVELIINKKDIQLSLYPNPATNIINYSFDNDSMFEYTVCIYNLAGKLVYQSVNKQNTFAGSVDIENLSPGNYFFEIKNRSEKLHGLFYKN